MHRSDKLISSEPGNQPPSAAESPADEAGEILLELRPEFVQRAAVRLDLIQLPAVS
ncbi:MAG: hypothetical protein ABI140_19000 [Jatrophihabitantaceae bacterium]